jgi:hypothetical protein
MLKAAVITVFLLFAVTMGICAIGTVAPERLQRRLLGLYAIAFVSVMVAAAVLMWLV